LTRSLIALHFKIYYASIHLSNRGEVNFLLLHLYTLSLYKFLKVRFRCQLFLQNHFCYSNLICITSFICIFWFNLSENIYFLVFFFSFFSLFSIENINKMHYFCSSWIGEENENKLYRFNVYVGSSFFSAFFFHYKNHYFHLSYFSYIFKRTIFFIQQEEYQHSFKMTIPVRPWIRLTWRFFLYFSLNLGPL
jgi:hypothetical protein